jgi:AraC family transcriptional regulator, activator of mtrCDE
MPRRTNSISGRINQPEQHLFAVPAKDLIDALAPVLRVKPVIEEFCRFGGAWRSARGTGGTGWAQFHIVARGAYSVEQRGMGTIQLAAGDILLLPHGDGHIVRSRIGGPLGPVETDFRNAIRASSSVGVEADSELVCERLLFETGEDNSLAAALPEAIIIITLADPLLERFRDMLTDIRDELDSGRLGSNLIATNLASALFAMMLRLHPEQVPKRGSLLSLLQDRTTAKVVLAMLRDTAKDWTLDEMAVVGITSRATLVRAFRHPCGLAPIANLARLRLDLARQRLAGTNDPISEVAASIGYKSEAALSKAFLRRFGIRPGAVRPKVQGIWPRENSAENMRAVPDSGGCR